MRDKVHYVLYAQATSIDLLSWEILTVFIIFVVIVFKWLGRLFASIPDTYNPS